MHRSFVQPAQPLHIQQLILTHTQIQCMQTQHMVGGVLWRGGEAKAWPAHFPPLPAVLCRCHCRCRSRRQAQQVHVTLRRRVAQSLRRRVGQQQKQKLKHQAIATCRPGRALVPECLPATTIAHTHTHAHMACTHICGRVSVPMCVCECV